MSWNRRWMAFDTETTGFNSDARILEIGLVFFEDGQVTDCWSQLLNPEGVDWNNVDVQKALEINQINRSDLEGKPTFGQVHEELLDRLACHMVWVAHNADFDLRMFRQEFNRLGEFPLPDSLVLDTMCLDFHINPHAGVYRLGSVAERWGVAVDGDAHRATTDATTCGNILHKMMLKEAIPSSLSQAESLQKTATIAWKNKPRRR